MRPFGLASGHTHWRHPGTKGFLGQRSCQGQALSPRSGLQATALILMGDWCGSATADTTRTRTRVRHGQAGYGGFDRMRSIRAQESLVPLARGRLMGDPSCLVTKENFKI